VQPKNGGDPALTKMQSGDMGAVSLEMLAASRGTNIDDGDPWETEKKEVGRKECRMSAPCSAVQGGIDQSDQGN